MAALLWLGGIGKPLQIAAAAPPQADSTLALRLRNGTYTTTPGASFDAILPQNLRQQASSSPTFWMVQFAAPVRSAWVAALRAEGLAIVAYVPDYAYIVWGGAPDKSIRRVQTRLGAAIHWDGAYHPAFRLAKSLQAGQTRQAPPAQADVTVQLYTHAGVESSIERLQNLALAVLRPPERVMNFTNLRVRLPQKALAEVAAWEDVFNIEPWSQPKLMDEGQGQILAGKVTQVNGKTIPSAPGYLSFLSEAGFPTAPSAYPIVDVVDSGLDTGTTANLLHPDFYQFGSKDDPLRVPTIANCTSAASGNDTSGHGTLNAGIVAGYNYQFGAPYEDARGYQYGLGISPYGRITATKIFNERYYDATNCGWSDSGVVERSYQNGAAITSNSWGSDAYSEYDATAQAYDYLTRDASSLTPGNQEVLHIFSAGNAGGLGTRTIGSPATAKNVLSVGATENVRDEGIADICGWTQSDNADDIAPFSSRGPTQDGRVKPDIVAPGIHIQGPASQDADFKGTGICHGASSIYYPSGQTLYTWSSGTSHSAPAVAGAAQLAYEYYQRVIQPGKTPSPAMLKALLLGTTRYLDGLDSGDRLPSIHQGWGDPNLSLLFSAVPRLAVDQTVTFTDSLQEYTLSGQIADTSKPVRITLAWSDAPGAPPASVYVNDLNLEVIAGGQIYKGNVFKRDRSAPGGEFDAKNNVENVFLPAGVGGSFQVRVIAANIAGDGVPGNSEPLDQDFALMIHNAAPGSASVLLVNPALAVSDPAGNQNGYLDPGEAVSLQVSLLNLGTAPAFAPTATLSIAFGEAAMGVTVSAVYSDLSPGSIQANAPPDFAFTLNLRQPCGSDLWFWLDLTYNVSEHARLLVGPLPVGRVTNNHYAASGLPQPIPDQNYTGVKVPVEIPERLSVRRVTVGVDITHTWTQDLTITLLPPRGEKVYLSVANGGSSDNYTGTIFDDDAAEWIINGFAPFTGRWKPETPLAVLEGIAADGDWQLHVIDRASPDTGTIDTFTLEIEAAACEIVGMQFYLPEVIKLP